MGLRALSSAGFFLGFAIAAGGSILGWVIVPHFIQSRVQLGAQLIWGSETLRRWEKSPYKTQLKFYIYNITTPDAILKGERIKLVDHGPYIYNEQREKINIQMDSQQRQVTYQEIKKYHFDQQASNGTQEDVFNVPNVPLISTAHVASVTKKGMNMTLAQVFFRVVTGSFGNETIVKSKASVKEILFDGWKMNGFFAGIPPEDMPEDFRGLRFGLFRHRNNSDEGVFTIRTGRDDHRKFGEIVSWNGLKELSWWPNRESSNLQSSSCNKINGSDGSLYPPFISTDTVLRAFSPHACRSFSLVFDSESIVKGIQGYRFKPSADTFAQPPCNKENDCFCQKQSPKVVSNCIQGINRIFGCRNGAPMVTSNAHFLYGGDELFKPILIDPPVREDHESFVDIEPMTGAVLRAKKRFQVNIELQNLRDFALFNALNFKNITDSPSIILPIVWGEQYTEISDELAGELYGRMVRVQNISSVVTPMALVLGVIICIISGFMYRRRQHLKAAI